jgi:hypothetical protein
MLEATDAVVETTDAVVDAGDVDVVDSLTGWDSPEVTQVYVVIEESAAVAQWASDLDHGVAALRDALAGSDLVQLTVLGFATEVTAHLTPAGSPGDNGSAGAVPFAPEGRTSYASLFTDLAMRLPADLERLAASGRLVRRPLVVLLTRARPTGRDWRPVRDRLLRVAMPSRFTPDIVVFGIGPVDQRVIADLPTDRALAFTATSDEEAGPAIRRFFAGIADAIEHAAEVDESERVEAFARAPEGFTRLS